MAFLSAGDLSEKTTIYSTLVGILNARKMEVGEEVRILTSQFICGWVPWWSNRNPLTPEQEGI